MTAATVILQLICPDRPGLVSELAGWVAANGGNIRHADHHTDAARECSSAESNQLEGFGIPRQALPAAAQALADRLLDRHNFTFQTSFQSYVFASKQSHCLRICFSVSKR